MYTHFIYKNGGNPYIAKTPAALFSMIIKHDIDCIGENTFEVLGDKKAVSYTEKKEAVRAFAIDFSLNFSDFRYSYSELLFYQSFFELYGARYGLLKEFHSNAIC